MKFSWSVSFYRFLMHAYPVEFRNRYGESVDQAFRDMHRDAFQERGYLGVALLWFHVVPDFLFSAGEVLMSKAGDFLKWRFRLQWVVACTLGFALSRLLSVAIGREFIGELERSGSHGCSWEAFCKSASWLAVSDSCSLAFSQADAFARNNGCSMALVERCWEPLSSCPYGALWDCPSSRCCCE